MASPDDEPSARVAGEPSVEATVESKLPERPAGDELARAVARAKVANQLFATDRRVKLGRYHLLEPVGAGGMGVVWGAWDPELDRRVAIKLVHEAKRATRDRILAEGQALAKLSHPNVVPVFDVGVVDDQVYIVMEWVRGKNLRQWCSERRSVREIVAVYRQAGQGLAAAHGASLIHRDFKPDNAIRGDDGRVRVLDFGLARGEIADGGGDGELTHGAGTPKYMAPEQIDGEALTPAADQFAFCVSLREAIAGREADGKPADTPGWVDGLLDRGAADDPKARFPSMDALVHALGRDPATVWRRRIVVATAVAAVGGAFAIGSLRASGGELAHCVGGGAEIAKTWHPGARAKVAAHLDGLGPYARGEAAGLARTFDAYAESWAAARDGACVAQERGELTPQLYERDIGCLARARVALDTAVELLSTATQDRVANAVTAARSLPDAERCADTTTSKVAPPAREITAQAAALANEIERARVLAVAVDPKAVDVAAATVAAANRLGYAPLVARANLAHGLALGKVSIERAASAYARAVDAAIDSDDDATFVEAFARQLYAVAVSESAKLEPGVDKVLRTIPYAKRIADRNDAGGPLGRARLLSNIGSTRLAARDRLGARMWFALALTESARAGDNVELAGIKGNYALVVDDPAVRARLLAQQIGEDERVLGANHPVTLDARLVAATLTTDRIAAAAAMHDAVERLRRFHPHLQDSIDAYAYELAWLDEERGDTARARDGFTSIHDPDSARVARGYIDLIDGRYAAAADAMTALANQLGRSSEWWVKVAASDADFVAAVALLHLHRNRAAAGALEEAVALLETYASRPGYERRLARCRRLLARLVDPPRAVKLATLALDWYRSAGGYDAVVVDLETFTAAATTGRGLR